MHMQMGAPMSFELDCMVGINLKQLLPLCHSTEGEIYAILYCTACIYSVRGKSYEIRF